MKRILSLIFILIISKTTISQTIYYDKLLHDHAALYDGDSTLKETAKDLASLFNKALNTNTFNIDTLPVSGGITSGIVLKIDTNLILTQRLQYCSAVSNGTSLLNFTASTSNGVRYGVYAYMAELGFKFYGPDSTWDIIPTLTTPYKAINKVYQTKFQYHSFVGQGDFGPVAVDTLAYNSIKWNLFRTRNNMIHEYDLQGHIGEGWVWDNNAFLIANPCYIAEYNGSHTATWGAMPSIQNTAAMQHWADYAFSSYNSINIAKSPWARSVVSIEASDGPHWGNTATSCGLSQWPSASEQSITLANFATNSLKSKFPYPIHTSIFAYDAHFDTTAIAIDSLIQVGVTFGWQSETSPTGLLDRWKKKHPHGVFEYDYMNLPDGTLQSPFTDLNYLNYQAKRCNITQTLGYHYEGTAGLFPTALYQIAFHKSIMDGTGVADNLNSIITDMYSGSAIKIKELFGYWSNDDHWTGSEWLFNNIYRFPLYLKLINDAAALSASSGETKRINLLKSYMHYLILMYEMKLDYNQTTKYAKADQLLNYMVSIYNSGIINSYQQMNITLSTDVTKVTLSNWVDTIAKTWKPGPFLAVTPINDTQINLDFAADTTAYPILDKFNMLDVDSLIQLACKANLVPLDTINVSLKANYPSGQTLYITANGKSSIRILYNKKSANKKLNFVIDSQDQLYTETIVGDTITQSGYVDLDIPSAGKYQVSIMYPNTVIADIKIITNGNYFYRFPPFYNQGIELYKDSISAPRYIYVPKGVKKLYFAMPGTLGDTTLFSNNYHFTNAIGATPKLHIEPSDSNQYYFNVDTLNDGKFWQLYVDTLAAAGWTFSFVNTQNVHLYLKSGFCNPTSIRELHEIDFSIYPNPTTGLLSLKMRADGAVKIDLFNVMGQNSYSKQNAKWNGNEVLDLSDLPTGLYFVKVENKGAFSTKKLLISK